MKWIIVSLVALIAILGVAALDEVLFKAEENVDELIEQFNSYEPNKQLLIGYDKINIELKINAVTVRRYHVLINSGGEITEINAWNIGDADFTIYIPLSIAKEWIKDGPKIDYEEDLNKVKFSDPLLKYEFKTRIEEIY